MNQSRLESAVEAALQTAIGYAVALVVTPQLLGLFGFHPSAAQNIGIVASFTAVSLVRGYAVRRFCNAYLHRVAGSVARFLSAPDGWFCAGLLLLAGLAIVFVALCGFLAIHGVT